jgi:4-hydroxy-tetrahydrodipicolinate synthase
MFAGSYVAIVTPFKNDEVDYEALERLIEMQIENGTAGLVPCGTTGESPTVSHQEHKKIIKFVIDKSAGRVPVVAGTGSNSTAEAVELTVDAAKAGADATLQVAPYYNKPEPEGMYQHFKTVAETSGLPTILYNIPGRSGRAITMDTICRLAEIKEIVALKAADGSLDNVSEVVRRTDLDVLSGDDSLTLPKMAVGGKGVISVAANIIPKDVADMCAAALKGDFVAARKMHLKMFPLFKAMFLETNPVPIKTAMAMVGMCTDEMRLPLSAMLPDARAKLEAALREYGILNN